MSKDEHLSKLVKEAFHKDEIISLQSIDITVSNGIDTLNGTVQVRWYPTYRIVMNEQPSSYPGNGYPLSESTVQAKES